MGRDKLPLTVGGVPILRRAYDALAGACDEVIIVLSGESSIPPAPDLPGGARPVRDLRSGEVGGSGPLAGLEAGLHYARYPCVFVAAGDMPFLPETLILEIIDRLRRSGKLAAVPRRNDRWEPLCAAYSGEALGHASRALDAGVRAMQGFVGSLWSVEEFAESDLWRFGDPETLLMNVNSPRELERARELVRGG